MIARILHLPSEKNKLLHKMYAHAVQEHMQEYEVDNRTLYDILDQICKDTDLYPYVKQHKPKRDGRGAFYAIHSRWLGPNHVNATGSEAEMALQMPTCDGEKTGSKVRHLFNGIRCDKLSTVVAAVRAHPDKCERDFNVVVAFLTQYIDQKAPTLSANIASVAQIRPAKWQKTNASYGTFKGKIELKKYSREEYNSMLMAQHWQQFKLWKKAGLIKSKKTPESSRALE